MLKRKTMMGIVGIAILGIAGSVYATAGAESECGMKKEKRVRAHVEWVLNKLDATEAQREQISPEVDNAIASIWELRGDHNELREALVTQWNQEQPDREALHALVDQKLDQIRATAHELIDSGLAVHGILNPEQRQKVSKKLTHGKRFRPEHLKRANPRRDTRL